AGLDSVEPLQMVPCRIEMGDGTVHEIELKCRIDTAIEVEYIEHGGVLHSVLRNRALAACAVYTTMKYGGGPPPAPPGIFLPRREAIWHVAAMACGA
ncbi:MAG: hypothetical protein AAF919_18630, partial [Pseudomonadota bacterium]